ncbi:MAG: ABC transporter permease subunit [Thermofilaceae archaeon]|nr:ABC transporter permease subunit [Thermofilaceae archaeon]MCX8179885.1 ABC transporter permease subunit [Thermofilaceae archaeon]MDW8004430.1 ABC transporter permease subunit [Thermofilaceae archaeon]
MSSELLSYIFLILDGMKFNLIIASVSFFAGLTVASVMFTASIASEHALSMVKAYVKLVRGIPPLVLLALVYWVFMPMLGLTRDPLLASILAFTLRTSAFQSQILRTTSASGDQLAAALALGMSKLTAARYVIVPQSLRCSLPALTNEFSSLLKESTQSLAVGVVDSLARARYVSISTGYSLIWIFLAGLIIYLTSTLFVYASRYLYKRFPVSGTVGSGEVTLWR